VIEPNFDIKLRGSSPKWFEFDGNWSVGKNIFAFVDFTEASFTDAPPEDEAIRNGAVDHRGDRLEFSFWG
jgi:hypothetical protein